MTINKSYVIYGKMGSMKRFKPVSGSRFVTNLLHAETFTPQNQSDIDRLKRELAFMQTQGTFELRAINQ